MLTVGGIGEEELVRRIRTWLPRHPRMVVGAGDDCGVLLGCDGWRLTKTDAMVEGTHFLLGENAARVGWKALGRVLSDCGAMGGEPLDALVTLGLPRAVTLEWVEGFYRGLVRLAARFDVAVAGGETTSSGGGPLWISIALNGRVGADDVVRRSGGRPGDELWVTGQLGGALLGHHLDFVPRVREGAWLAKVVRPRAMMDVSDGLARDLPRLAGESDCGWEVRQEWLPLTPGCGVGEGLGDGEDYELLFAVEPGVSRGWMEAWRRQFPVTRLTHIGFLRGREVRLGLEGVLGWEHFRS